MELRLNPPTGADPAFHRAAQIEREQMFPMNTVRASSHLRSRGYFCRPQMLDLLVENGAVKLEQPDVWLHVDVDRAAEQFEDCGILTPYAAMCETLGCRYADFLRPLREASQLASERYGRRVPADDQYFVMHRVPPRGMTDDQARLVGSTAAISFTICDDVRIRLERGEEGPALVSLRLDQRGAGADGRSGRGVVRTRRRGGGGNRDGPGTG